MIESAADCFLIHRRDAEGAEKKFLYEKPLRTLRLCGEKIPKFLERGKICCHWKN